MTRTVRRGCSIAIGVLLMGAMSHGARESGSIRGFSAARIADEHALEQKFRAIPDPAHAESNLRQLTSEPHLAGTEASKRVAEWLRSQYQSYGFDTQIVSYSVWMAQPKQVSLELTTPQKETLATPEAGIPEDKDTFDKRAVMAFNAYVPSADVTASVVYVNYGTQEDYRVLQSLGISVEGKIALARYGRCYRGIKTKLAEEHKAVGVILYSDPEDDGYDAGDMFPRGPWRPMSGIQRGSVEYTQIYPGDPLTPGVAATLDAKRLAPAEATNLSHIPTLPINPQDGAAILSKLDGPHVPRSWQGGLPFTYHVGAGSAVAHIRLVMDYQQRPIFDVIAKLHGTSDDEWVVLGNHHDAWVFGAVDPSSGTATMLETARGLGDLVRSGWKPRRTIVMCEWDGEEEGLIGSTEWVEQNRAELQAKAVAYLNTDVGVAGPNLSASAVPSLKEFVRDATRSVSNPQSGESVYETWRAHDARAEVEELGSARPAGQAEASGEAPISALGAGSDFCPFLDFAGIPSADVGFVGDYGVYHSLYDDFYWMKKFGDPEFKYHAALAKLLGTMALRLDEADVLPFDYGSYAGEISRAVQELQKRAGEQGINSNDVKPVVDAAGQLSESAAKLAHALQSGGGLSIDPGAQARLNRDLASVDQALLTPEGLRGRTWYKHTIYAPGSYAGYSAEVLPGPSEALDRKDAPAFETESKALAAALRRAAARLDEITKLSGK
ncbi:MAG: M28 family metallopeptidase [Candidatus Acidiferrales bacterium]